jgi:hypothetical protein
MQQENRVAEGWKFEEGDWEVCWCGHFKKGHRLRNGGGCGIGRCRCKGFDQVEGKWKEDVLQRRQG